MSENHIKQAVPQYTEGTGSPLREQVPEFLAGQRVDAVAARLFPDHSRARLRGWLECGRLRVNGVAVLRPRQPVTGGDWLELDAVAEARETVDAAQDIPLNVVYADAALAIIDKPAGLVVHPGAGVADGTLLNALLARFPQTADVPRAGIVHRLDKDTSGLLVVALNLAAHTRLVAALAARDIHRQYDAIVTGVLVAGGSIDAPIGRDPRHRTRMAVNGGGRRAVTHFTVTRRYARHTRVAVVLETGRTHQIRVHFAHLHHPIVGDAVYASRRLSGVVAADAFPRQALHARRLVLAHPVSGERMAFECAPPPDFLALAAALEGEHD